jgi:hypothetical protein
MVRTRATADASDEARVMGVHLPDRSWAGSYTFTQPD